MSLEGFHPAVRTWFAKQFAAPTEPQRRAWPSIRERRHTLIAAPTGSGKTLAAFLAAIDSLVTQGAENSLPESTHVVYVSPLKALSNDIQRNLEVPLEGIGNELQSLHLGAVKIRTLVRTGDTPSAERTAMLKRPPHILVTTPESLYILLTSEGGRRMLRTARTLIVDEIHALVGNKRGSHLALSMERLQALVGHELLRVGLSATQRPIEEVARYLVGSAGLSNEGIPACNIIDSGHSRRLDLGIEVLSSPLEAVMSGEVWQEVYDRLAQLIREHRTTLIFTNTRRMAERVARHLGERLGEENVSAHHGSIARQQRLAAEQQLKSGALQALVATASLELGIDIGSVDLVCQLGSVRSIATLLQRVGRSGHRLGSVPKGRLFPLSRDELVECAALMDSARRGELDTLTIPQNPLDILAQQMVAAAASQEWTEEELYALVRRAYPYRHLPRTDFDAVLRMLAEGYSTRRGRRHGYVHHDAINHRVRGRRGARLASITSGGAIPDTADYDVILEPEGSFIGTVNEDFAVESLAGDIFQLGNASWRIIRIEPGKVRVEDARGQPPSIPFWLGEAPSRSAELSAAVSRLRLEVAQRLDGKPPHSRRADEDSSPPSPTANADPPASAVNWLVEEVGLSSAAARQLVDYLWAAQITLGVMPSQKTIVMERFFDESGGMQLVIHSLFGSRVNRAWGLALRKRFCRKFNFELQAAATEDAIVLSLGHSHSFPLEEVFNYLRSQSVRPLLIQALLDAPMFNIRWRWNATRALAVLRWRSGKKSPAQLQRMNSEDLLAAVFPDQVACAENLVGAREIPDHPLVRQTIRDCLEEAMDIDGFESLLRSMERDERRLVARDLREPSPLAAEILTARPYAFLDDAPLEERRTQAVYSRRWLDPKDAADLGALDQAAIDQVRGEAWPQVQNADELHEALLQLGFLTEQEGCQGAAAAGFCPQNPSSEVGQSDKAPAGEANWEPWLQELIAERRAARLHIGSRGPVFWVAAERLPEFKVLFPSALVDGKELYALTPGPPHNGGEADPIEEKGGRRLGEEALGTPSASSPCSPEQPLVEVLRGRLEAVGPVTAQALAVPLGLPAETVQAALVRLEAEGFVLRGQFTPGNSENEWCVRHLLARVHRRTINRLRQEIEPVASADFIRFLLTWQQVNPDHRGEGPESLSALLEKLEGFEAPATAWEAEIFPARLIDYDPAWLDSHCLSGEWVWSRLTPPKPNPEKNRSLGGPIRSSPIALVSRKNFSCWDKLVAATSVDESKLSLSARTVLGLLTRQGACFFADLVVQSGLLRTQVEDGLGELAAWGLITADSFTGLRALLTPSSKRPPVSVGRRKQSVAPFGMEKAGRWSLLRRDSPFEGGQRSRRDLEGGVPLALSGRPLGQNTAPTQSAAFPLNVELVPEAIARTLLRRYGVVFRRVLEREALPCPWRDLLRVYRRLEARGEIRGGRFVAGFSGEQFALPEAVAALRSIRRMPRTELLLSVSAADPLNLVGILTPGEKIAPLTANRILYRDGVPVAIRESKQIRFLVDLDSPAEWEIRNALLRRAFPQQLRAYLGKPA
jgi:ATP-dependent helicase Lhr and Lhr-like helicase